MTILEQITNYKRKEVAARKGIVPHTRLEQFPYFKPSCRSLSESLKNSNSGIIAEHKRKSPSKSVINDAVLLNDVVLGYEKAGAAGISVLTDTKFFGGSLDDLCLARKSVDLPILRKEFIVDAYQIIEAKAFGADVILLIAACLEREAVKELSQLAQSLGLEVLLEVHNEKELERNIFPSIDIIGVNNRNLKTFDVNIETSISLTSMIPDSYVKITESGLNTTQEIQLLKESGYQGFLMGERFLKTENPGDALAQFIHSL